MTDDSEIIDIEEEEHTSALTGVVFKRILGLVSPYKKWVFGFLITIGLTSVFDSLFTYINKNIIDLAIVGKNVTMLWRLGTLYGFFLILQTGMVFTFIYLAGILGERIQYDLRKNMFDHLQDLSLSYFSKNSVGRLIARVTSDSGRVADLMTWGLLDTTWAIMNITTAAIFMLIINWKMALIVLAILPILIIIAVKFRKKILVEFRNSRRANSKITGAHNENIQGVHVVKALGREDENLREFQKLTDKMYDSTYRAAWLSALFLPTVQIITSIALGFIVWFGGIQSLSGALTIGGIYAFVSYLTFIMWPIQDIARVYAEMQHSIASAERIFKLIDTVPEVSNKVDAYPVSSIHGEIEFQDVDFYYEERQPILKDFNLKVLPGETIALVGPTGGGKTTIVNLLCRFYEPSRGKIKINGSDYTDFTLQSIQSKIGVVLQTPHLFSGSIRENIRYGNLDANDSDIEFAAQLAGAHDFITTLPKGYEENVGEGGDLLSVGQKQLISLARAILSKPEIFIMDEATSSVDTLTEASIQKGMETLMQNTTSFIIAHRLSTIKRANRIVVIDNGKIVEMGSHAELMQKRGKYYDLFIQQFKFQHESFLNSLKPVTQPD